MLQTKLIFDKDEFIGNYIDDNDDDVVDAGDDAAAIMIVIIKGTLL